jgi:PAS domain S-box-containing protein
MNSPTSDPDSVQRMLRMLADQAHEHAVFLMDSAGRVVWYSLGAARLFALRPGEGLGENLEFIFTPGDRALGIAQLERVIANSDAISEDDRWHQRRDGSRFWSSGAMIALRDDAGELVGFGKILRDRTDLKEQLEALSNEVSLARKVNTEKDLAIAKLAHELRNVYAGIQAGFRLIGRDLTREHTSVADLMRHQLQLMERLTEDLLEAQRLTGEARITIMLAPVTLQQVLRDVYAQLEERAQHKRISLQLFAPPTPMIVQGDQVRLHQIFSNLLDNAIKYTADGGRIWIKATVTEQEAVISIEDTGRGIAPEMLTRIFELFTQVDANASGGGLGLGLTLVRELTRLHHGSVQATSKGLQQGSEFTVRLPLDASDPM